MKKKKLCFGFGKIRIYWRVKKKKKYNYQNARSNVLIPDGRNQWCIYNVFFSDGGVE